MKLLVFFLVAAMVIFPADSRDFPGKPGKRNFVIDHNERTSSQLVDSNSMEGRKLEKKLQLRVRSTFRMKHKASGKYIRPEEKENEALLKFSSKVDSWNDMSFETIDEQKGLGYIVHIATNKVVYPKGRGSISEPPLILANLRTSEALFSYDQNKSHIQHADGKYIHPQGGRSNSTDGTILVLHKAIHRAMEFTFQTISTFGNISEDIEKLTKDISEMKIVNQAMKKSLDALKADNTKLTQADTEMKKSLGALKADNTKLTQTNSQLKTENQAIKSSLDSLQSSNSRLTQASSQMNSQLQAIKNSQNSLISSNSRLTQASSQMNSQLQAIKNSQSSLISSNSRLTQASSQMNSQLQAIKNKQGPLTFSTEKVSWYTAVSRCRSLGARLAVLTNPSGFHTYMYYNYRGQFFWLGASDISREGTWYWINGQRLSSFPWRHPQPDNYQNEDCLHWGGPSNYNDIRCTYRMGYVCEHGYN